MADENKAATESGAKETDWEAKYKAMREHSREWERKAKENQSAADELEKLRSANLSEAEKEKRRADNAEAELAKLKADAQRRTDADEVSAKTGVPLALLLHCSDREDMEAFAREYEAENHIPAAPAAPATRINRSDGAGSSNRDAFAELLAQAFGN